MSRKNPIMSQHTSRADQIVDHRAVWIAGFSAGAIFLLLLCFVYPLVSGSTPWVILRFIGAIALGENVLPPPVSFDLGVTVVATLIHFALSLLFTYVVAFVLHRWGLLVGIAGGALLGAAIYAINFFALTVFFPWFYPARAWPFLAAHVLFGALSGGIYELLDDDADDAPFFPTRADSVPRSDAM